ncbi:MAG: hypothetical protein LBQ88_12455 [Treponema sp.]|jgi:hypothetical protein|nr:hypothetical protein [Treponema sp.]
MILTIKNETGKAKDTGIFAGNEKVENLRVISVRNIYGKRTVMCEIVQAVEKPEVKKNGGSKKGPVDGGVKNNLDA